MYRLEIATRTQDVLEFLPPLTVGLSDIVGDAALDGGVTGNATSPDAHRDRGPDSDDSFREYVAEMVLSGNRLVFGHGTCALS